MNNRKRYDDKFRASAIIMLEAQGYPNKEGALTSVANHLNVPKPTLYRWFTAKQNPPSYELVTEKRIEFKAVIRKELDSIFKDMPNARQDASYRDLGTVAGILLDKLQLLEGEPTSITENRGERVMPPLSDDTLEDVLNQYASGNTD